MEQLPHEEMRGDLPPALLVVRRISALDVELTIADRAHGEARARVVGAELLAQRGIGDSKSHGPQFSRIHRPGAAAPQPSFEGFPTGAGSEQQGEHQSDQRPERDSSDDSDQGAPKEADELASLLRAGVAVPASRVAS